MVAGLDVLLFKPDAELRRLARLAIDTGVAGAFVEGRSPAEIDAALAATEDGRAWLDELEAIKEPWFHMATGDGLYHTYGSWFDDPTIPYASLIGYVAALEAGEEIERPTGHIAAERDRLAVEYAALLDDDARKGFEELLALSRTVFPYVEEHKFICDYWFLTSWWNKIREFGDLLVAHDFLEDRDGIFQLSRLEVHSALDELVLSWATGGQARGPTYWPPIVAGRRELLERLGDWTPPPAVGAVPEVMMDPALIMLWGVTTQRVHEWARNQEGGSELTGTAASPGVVEGVARVVGPCARSETSATAKSSSAASPRPPGRRSSRRSRRQSPTSAASCRMRRSSAASTGCRRSSARVAPPPRSARASASAWMGRPAR